MNSASAKVFAFGENACTPQKRRRPEGRSGSPLYIGGNFKISILTVPSRSAPDEPLRFVWRFFFHCPSPPSGHEAFLVPEYKLSGVEFDAIIQLARAHLAESEAG